jgi:hypothetical protein
MLQGTEKLVGSSVEFCTEDYEERTWVYEAEESPLIDAVAREWLMKTQQDGKRLRSRCIDL